MDVGEDGHLKNKALWDHEIARQIAANDQITLNSDHFIVIEAYRVYVEANQASPSQRQLLPLLQQHWPDPIDAAIKIHQLFPHGAQQIAKFGGLPMPKRCL